MAHEGVFSKFLASGRGRWVILLLAVVGILLLLLGGMFDGNTQKAEVGEDSVAYRRMLEEELTALCSGVAGAGRVQLVITLAGGEEAVYATDSRDGQNDYVLSGGEGLLLYRKNPAVLGVGVVCQGGRDATVRQELTALLSATLGIGSNRIYISYT